jgi:hypothetical protein
VVLTVTPSAGRVGAGSRVLVTCDNPAVYYITGELADFSAGTGGLNGQAFSGFGGNTNLQLGYTDSPTVQNKLDNFGSANGLVDGAAVTLLLAAWDVSNGFLESAPFTGFLWDPVSHLPALLGRVVDMLNSGGTGGLSAVLAAVRKTY